LLLAKMEDDTALGPPAREVLADVSRVFPKYPDVRAALIRRENQDGRSGDARRRLELWLQREPTHPLALRLERELAA